MTVMVTGAAGHIGGTLVRLLSERHRVRALVHHDRRALEGLDVEQVPGDVRDLFSLRRAFAGARVVYHAAGYISIRSDEWTTLHAINVLGTRNVVQACLDCGVQRLVHFSSVHALSPHPVGVLLDESRPYVDPDRAPPYDRSKAAGERQVRWGMDTGLDAVIVRPTGVIGPYDYRLSHMGRVLLSMARGGMLALVNGGFDWVDVRDVAEGAVRAGERAPAGATYMLSGHWVSMRDIARAVGSVTGVRVPRLVCPLSVAQLGAYLAVAHARLTGGQPLFTPIALGTLRYSPRVSHQRAVVELGYRSRSFEETIRDTLDWFHQAGYLDRSVGAHMEDTGGWESVL